MSALDNILQDWLKYLGGVRGMSKHTLTAYAGDMRQFVEFAQEHLGGNVSVRALLDFEAKDGRAWLANRGAAGLDAASNARALSSIKNFYRWLEKQGRGRNDAILNLRAPKLRKPLPKAVGEWQAQEAVQNIANLQQEEWIGLRDAALLTLIYGCGLRISEALSLRRAELEGAETLTVTGKGNKQRRVPVLPAVREALAAYLSLCPFTIGKSDPVFKGEKGKPLQPAIFQKQIRHLRTLIGLPESATPHAFRVCSRRCSASGARTIPSLSQPGPKPSKADVPKAEIEYLDTGHFALEEDLDVIAKRAC